MGTSTASFSVSKMQHHAILPLNSVAKSCTVGVSRVHGGLSERFFAQVARAGRGGIRRVRHVAGRLNLLRCCVFGSSNSVQIQNHSSEKYIARTHSNSQAALSSALSSPVPEILKDSRDALCIQDLVSRIKANLACLQHSEGEISVSAYDTAWIARIPDGNDKSKPQFPKSLGWIVENQHEDGSWGDELKPWLYDRIAQTLACIVTLKYWTVSPVPIQRGEEYVKRYADKLQNEEISTMPIGFELYFPVLLMEAKNLGVNIPYDTSFFLTVQQQREEKLKKIPLRLLHARPTTMLHTLEGVQDLDVNWHQLLKFCSEDGSICCSPSSTAVLYMYTRDEACLSFLQKVVLKFKNAAPTVFPLDTFHNLWVVDTLERLGISRHFEAEIKKLLAGVYRSWSDVHGICWAQVLKDIPDLDDTSMAFRLLRQHGYTVSAESFKEFQKEKSFVCFAVGQAVQGVSDMLNLYRASQVSYPYEKRLHDAETFSQEFLLAALANNKENADKWSLKTDLSGEIKFALKYPKYKNLERMEIHHYLQMYGPEDAWIGKTIYRLALVNNVEYLQLAKMDFNLCQRLHQEELQQILRWISDTGIQHNFHTRRKVVMIYTMFSSEIWEPNFSLLRIVFGKLVFIIMTIYRILNEALSACDVYQFLTAIERWDPSAVQSLPENFSSCFAVLFEIINKAPDDTKEQSCVMSQLLHTWKKFVSAFLPEVHLSCNTRAKFECHHNSVFIGSGLEAVALSCILMSGHSTRPDFTTWIEKDFSFLSVVKDAVRLAQKVAMTKHQGSSLAFTTMSMVGSDDGNSLRGEADFVQLRKHMYREVNLSFHLSNGPDVVKRVLLAFTKVSNFYFENRYEPDACLELQRVLADPAE